MLNLYKTVNKEEIVKTRLSSEEVFSIRYHDIFDHPLNFAELIKWKSGYKRSQGYMPIISRKNDLFFLEGREGLIYKRLLRKRISVKKLEIAKKASRILALTPSVKMVAVTGSLAMQNSTEEGDIDLMIITKKGTLWTTRLISYLVTRLFGIKVRKPADKDQKDKLCLNMWLDESSMSWHPKQRNFYTAHEIAQIVPLVNKNRTYEKFLYKNRWILEFWPSAVKIKKTEAKNSTSGSNLIEKISYWLQKKYMGSKITREVVSPTRALFHPQDWGRIVLSRFPS